jgi:hypothetical protein
MSKTRLLFLDMESYYDDEFSLRKMPTPSYILDSRFEVQMCAVKEGNEPSHIVDGIDFPKYLAQFDPAHTTTVTFNSLFDNSILAWRYGFVPSLMLDTMGMARALRGHLLASASLDSVCKCLGLPVKDDTLVKVKGLRRGQIQGDLWRAFCNYANGDNERNSDIYDLLSPEFPSAERRVMDLVIRCTINPRFQVDQSMLHAHLQEIRDYKAALLRDAGGDIATLMSSDKFKEKLEGLGVEIEYKTSVKGKQIPAFAKTDQFMEDLLASEDPRIQALASARLGHKSTLEETRSQKLLDISMLPWAAYRGGNPATMPVPLRYGGAHTTRLSGEWGMNMQNLPTERGSKGKSKLRKSLVVPADCVVLAVDLGQIEARLVAWICGATLLLRQFAEGKDPYAMLASQIFGYPVDRKVQKVEGFIGKTGILGSGYGCGWEKFFNMVMMSARQGGIELGTMWTKALAKKAIETYRRVHFPIPDTWHNLDSYLASAWMGKGAPRKFGPCVISKGAVLLPNGLSLNYADPGTMPSDRKKPFRGLEKCYRYGKRVHKIYGAKLLENIIQALARIIVMNAALRIADRGHKFVLQGHDELVYIVRKDELDKAKEIIHTEMVRSPSWAPTLPLTAEIKVGPSYGDLK